jgi:hypothetical protein
MGGGWRLVMPALSASGFLIGLSLSPFMVQFHNVVHTAFPTYSVMPARER